MSGLQLPDGKLLASPPPGRAGECLGVLVMKFKNLNVRGAVRQQVKKESEKETRLRLAAADMKPLTDYWSTGKNIKTK